MGVRYGLLLPLFFLGVLPLARVAVTFVYAMFVGLACAMPFMAMLAWLTWREFDHPAPATRREPRAGDPYPRRDPSAPVSEEEDEYDDLAGDDDASPVRTVAVIGGGAAGLATLRQMLAHGMDAVLFERTDNIGGLWDYNSPERSKVFRNVLQNVTKTHNRFAGHRPPKHWPIYLGHEHTLEYLRSFVDTFELKDRIRLGCEVLSCVETERGGFELAIETETVVDSNKKSTKKSKRPHNKPGDGDVPVLVTEKVTRYERFDAVCVCTGQLTAPSIPDDIVGLAHLRRRGGALVGIPGPARPGGGAGARRGDGCRVRVGHRAGRVFIGAERHRVGPDPPVDDPSRADAGKVYFYYHMGN